MPFTILIDNWTLQDAGKLLTNGVTDAEASQIEFSPNGAEYEYSPLPFAAVGLECLWYDPGT